MGRFVPDRETFFDSIYHGVAPWDIGAAQPDLLALFERYPLADPVLDIGCGTGDLAIELARQGNTVLGIDLAAAAITQATDKGAQLPPASAERVSFRIADGLRLAELGEQFASIVDSGFLHVLESPDRVTLVEQLGQTLTQGGRYYLLGFATDFPLPNSPIRVTEEELRQLFVAEKGWTILHIAEAQFRSQFAPVPAIAACIERTG